MLNELRLKPPSEGDVLFHEPQKKVLIVLGRTEFLEERLGGQLKRFIENGGAVLIATDRPTSEALFQEIGVQVSGIAVRASPISGNAYREMAECPLVLDVDRATQNGQTKEGFLFQGFGHEPRVATNLPSEIRRCQGMLPIATLHSPGQDITFNGRLRLRRIFRDQKLFAVAGSSSIWKKGRLLVLADHSIFINDMMLQPDNDNIPFAFNVGRWLIDAGDGTKRSEILFFEDGQLQTEFNVSLEYPRTDPPPLEAFVPVANELLVGLERENAFNKMLFDATGGPFPIFRGLAIFLTLCLLAAGLFRFLNSRYRPESHAPIPAVDTVAVSTIERRHQAVIAQGNLAEAARELTLEAFASIGLTPVPNIAPPRVTVPGSWFPFHAWRWQREVRELWKLAAKGPDHRVSPAALQKLDESLRNLLAAVAADKVRLASPESAI